MLSPWRRSPGFGGGETGGRTSYRGATERPDPSVTSIPDLRAFIANRPVRSLELDCANNCCQNCCQTLKAAVDHLANLVGFGPISYSNSDWWAGRESNPQSFRGGFTDRRPPSVHSELVTCVLVRRCGCHLGCQDGENWRGWMGIEPTQDASAVPRKRF